MYKLSILLSNRLRKSGPLKALLRDLSLSGGDGRIRVGVDEATALLAVLELGTLSRADADSGGIDLGAAGRVAVGVSDTATGGELLVLAVANSVCARDVRGQGKGRGGDCLSDVSNGTRCD